MVLPVLLRFRVNSPDAVRATAGARTLLDAYAKYRNEIPDPLDLSTVRAAMLDWEARDQEPRQTAAIVSTTGTAGAKSSRGLPVQVLAARRPRRMGF